MDPSRCNFLKNNLGQSVVEYVLLLFVVVSLGVLVFNSAAFKDVFGPNSNVFTMLRKRMEYSYRYTQDGVEDTLGNNYSSRHDSYIGAGASKTHFFAPTSKYGN